MYKERSEKRYRESRVTWFGIMAYIHKQKSYWLHLYYMFVCTIFLDDYNVLWDVLFLDRTTKTTLTSMQCEIP